MYGVGLHADAKGIPSCVRAKGRERTDPVTNRRPIRLLIPPSPKRECRPLRQPRPASSMGVEERPPAIAQHSGRGNTWVAVQSVPAVAPGFRPTVRDRTLVHLAPNPS